MKSSRALWYSIGIGSLLCTCLFAAGFVYAIDHVINPKPSNLVREELPPKVEDPLTDGQYRILALGDSLTKGTGDTSGEGYAGKVKQQLEDKLEAEVFYINYAVNGYRTDQLLDDVLHRNGTMLQVQEADLILFTIGGNDLFNLTTTDLEINPEAARANMPAALDNLERILARFIELNPQAKIIYTGLHNPFIDVEGVAEEASLFVHDWNYEVQKRLTAYPTVKLVPTYDLFTEDVSELLASDHYHPNETGYSRIAERIGQVLAVRGEQQ